MISPILTVHVPWKRDTFYVFTWMRDVGVGGFFGAGVKVQSLEGIAQPLGGGGGTNACQGGGVLWWRQ